jgi:hypothetical protein
MLPDNVRSGDDKIIYTGGTTGLPKGVLWRHEDLYFSALAGANPMGAPHLSVGEVADAARGRPPGGSVIAPPLMHGSPVPMVGVGVLRSLNYGRKAHHLAEHPGQLCSSGPPGIPVMRC